uniref:ferroxidase n=1 Tax=Dermatophagoides pteronyssinus TaxID=6956 RepID=A0A6P6XU62_DERPT|nr:frataxin homolog, mitochondrial-like [Dermatophagoides pteronyssinus]
MISIMRSEFKSLFRIFYISVNNNKNRTVITPFYHNNDTSFLRLFSSSSSKELDEKTYEELVNKTLDSLNDHFEQFFEQIDDKNCDITFNNDVLTVSLGSKGVYVINRQTPNRQIWLSSPISGPKRYDYIDGEWIYRHDGQTIQQLLQKEMKQLFNGN